MSSVTTKRSHREEDSFKMLPTTTKNPSKYPKLQGERAVNKDRLGGIRKTTMTTMTTTTMMSTTKTSVLGKVEDDVKKRVVGDSLSCLQETECSPEILLEREDWPKFCTDDLLEEKMLWGSLWFPCSEERYSSMDGLCLLDEIIWEDDLWNLKAIKEIPTKP
ncbi:hypothetical protein NE237_020827 [Protea cynaroides]|uniref:Uncharacterized protein n=1 Tax=Protea cynaroides TaxID=273540 RepID=A0A9Q0K2Y2_9MAGN|nr:hypothetical protein NE237_020827 [Protea cynaroides]